MDRKDSDVDEYIKLKLVHEIHTSERRSFRACRRRWDWLFNEARYPITTAKPLEFGTAYHAAMEVYYEPSTWKMDRQVVEALAIKTFIDHCEAQRKAALALTDRITFDDDVETDYNERVELGRGMLEYYFKKVAPQVDVGWTPVKVEIGFMIAVPNPETGEPTIWCKCKNCFEKWWKHVQTMPLDQREFATEEGEWSVFEGLPVVYAGRLDMLAEDNVHPGNYWIFDWKTAASLAINDEFLYLDDQIGSYVWALRKLGINVRGFVYHEQRKGFPEPPKKNVNVRKGCSYSVSKSQTTDYETFLKFIQENDAVALGNGCYDEFLEFLRNEGIVFFARHQIHKSEEELLSIEEQIGLEALDMIDPNLRIYPSAGRFGCNFCAFRQPCMEKNAKGDYMYILETMYEKREHYYVRKEPSTESKGGE